MSGSLGPRIWRGNEEAGSGPELQPGPPPASHPGSYTTPEPEGRWESRDQEPAEAHGCQIRVTFPGGVSSTELYAKQVAKPKRRSSTDPRAWGTGSSCSGAAGARPTSLSQLLLAPGGRPGPNTRVGHQKQIITWSVNENPYCDMSQMFINHHCNKLRDSEQINSLSGLLSPL